MSSRQIVSVTTTAVVTLVGALMLVAMAAAQARATSKSASRRHVYPGQMNTVQSLGEQEEDRQLCLCRGGGVDRMEAQG